MQSQLPPGIEKLVRVEPQQLKSERQLSQPAQQASHVPARPGQQQLPGLMMPLAQWQVVRMLYAPHSVTTNPRESAYQAPPQSSPSLQFSGERGVLMAKFELDGQVHQLRWQITPGEAILLGASLAHEPLLKLLPSLNGTWRIVANGTDMVDPLQLLWLPIGAVQTSGLTTVPFYQQVWFKRLATLLVALGVVFFAWQG